MPAIAESDLRRRPDGKTHFVRAIVSFDEDGAWRVRPVVGQDSHQLRAMADANALAVLPDGDGCRGRGRVDVLLTDPERLSADPVGSGSPPDGDRGARRHLAGPRTGPVRVPSRAMPTEGPLVDRYGRVHDDLRISVTDRCNLRCTYCMPEEGMTFLPRRHSSPSRRSSGWPGWRRPRGLVDPAHRRRAAGPQGPRRPGGPAGRHRLRGPRPHHQRHAAAALAGTAGGRRAPAGERQLRLAATRPVRTRSAGGVTSPPSCGPWTRPRRPGSRRSR